MELFKILIHNGEAVKENKIDKLKLEMQKPEKQKCENCNGNVKLEKLNCESWNRKIRNYKITAYNSRFSIMGTLVEFTILFLSSFKRKILCSYFPSFDKNQEVSNN